MKNTKAALVLFLAMTLSNAWGAPTNVAVTVNGMVCSFCAQGITKKFKARPEVDKVKVTLNDQKVYLTLKDGLDISDQEMTKILRQSGYSVEKIERGK